MAPDDTAEPKATVDPPLPPPEEEGSESPFSSGGGRSARACQLTAGSRPNAS